MKDALQKFELFEKGGLFLGLFRVLSAQGRKWRGTGGGKPRE